jgi:Zn-dependent protease with chaperone function
MGVPGYNTRNVLAQLRSDGRKLRPDLVLLGLYVGNDITGNHEAQAGRLVVVSCIDNLVKGAAGVAVPEIYVLEQEAGINAFAAGYTPADAAIGVTRGTLDKLDRDELQGVIAHEFSHILNGDMRLNIRLMGVMFGILVLAIVGQRILTGAYLFGGSRSRSNNGNGAAAILAVGMVALIGLLASTVMLWSVGIQPEFTN